jgi:hypothetical protein
MNLDINKKQYLIIGVGMILFVKIFDWSNYFMLIGFIFIVLAFSNNKEEQSDKSNTDTSS